MFSPVKLSEISEDLVGLSTAFTSTNIKPLSTPSPQQDHRQRLLQWFYLHLFMHLILKGEQEWEQQDTVTPENSGCCDLAIVVG